MNEHEQYKITYKQASDKNNNLLPYGTIIINHTPYPLDRHEWQKLEACVALGDLDFFADWLLNRQSKPLTKKIPAKWDTKELLHHLAIQDKNECNRLSRRVDRLSKIMGIE